MLDYLLNNYKLNIKEIWNLRSAGVYSRWKDEKGDFKVIKEIITTINPISLLDIGYGYGRLSPILSDIPFVVGMDISRKMLEFSSMHNKGKQNINIVLGDIRQMPFKNNSFSCLISVRTLNHIHPDDLQSVERELFRLCRDAVILLESDIKIKEAAYEFEHNYDQFLLEGFKQIKRKLEEHVYLRVYHKTL